MHATELVERPSQGLHGPIGDLAAFARELLRPTLVGAPTARARRPSPSRGSTASCPASAASILRLGPRAGAARREAAALDGRAQQPGAFGHIGGSGTFLWVDPVADLGLVVLTDRDFGPGRSRPGRRSPIRCSRPPARRLACRGGDRSGHPTSRRGPRQLVPRRGGRRGHDRRRRRARYWGDLPRELAAMGRTHRRRPGGRSDPRPLRSHRLRRAGPPRTGTAGHVHELDAALARGEVPNPAKGGGPVKLLPLLRFLWFGATHGLLRTQTRRRSPTFGDGATLDVPGAPRVILVPGHTPGSAALHVPSHDALFVGDAISTVAVTTGAHGPDDRAVHRRPGAGDGVAGRLDGIEARLAPAGPRSALDGRRSERRSAGGQGCGGPGIARTTRSVSRAC